MRVAGGDDYARRCAKGECQSEAKFVFHSVFFCSCLVLRKYYVFQLTPFFQFACGNGVMRFKRMFLMQGSQSPCVSSHNAVVATPMNSGHFFATTK